MPDREQQFKQLFLSEYDRMYKAAYILLGDEDEAKDAVQDVFAKLWAGTSPLKEESQSMFFRDVGNFVQTSMFSSIVTSYQTQYPR